MTHQSAPDPRFGMSASITKNLTMSTPGGVQFTATETREAELADPLDLLSLTKQTETTVINGRTYTSSFDAAQQRVTLTTPSDRKRYATVDAQGRVLLAENPGRAPVGFSYDIHGRLITITEGTAPGAKRK